MKIDYDLVREILLAIEASDNRPDDWIENFSLDGREDRLVSYNIQLLAEARYIDAIELSVDDDYEWAPKRLTIKGHELLDSIRDPKAWRFAKDVAKRAGGATIDFLFEAAKLYLKEQLKKFGFVQ